MLVFSYCYHGSVDETFAVAGTGGPGQPRGQRRPAGRPGETTVAIEFNDVAALERALAGGEIAGVLAEPAMTNMGIVLPDAGLPRRAARADARAPARC